MKTSKIFKNLFRALILVTVYSVSLSTIVSVQAASEPLEQTVVPNTLDQMTEIGESVVGDANFAKADKVNRNYGTGWRLSNVVAEYGADSEYAKNPATVVQETLSDVPEGMSGIATAIKLTNHGSNFALGDALAYNSLESDFRYFDDKHIFYFSMWVKVEEETWFDVGISYADIAYADGAPHKHNKGQYYYDLGRKFKVTPEDGWTEIGVDESGNYLPFRTHGLGTDPNENISSSFIAERNAKEDLGNTYMDLPVGLNWSVIRIYAYGPNSEVATTNGLVGDGIESGITAETSYLATGVKFWPSGTTFTKVVDVESVALDVTTKELVVGKNFYLSPTVLPENADIEVTKYESSNSAIVTVNDFGQVTAKAVGTATITYTVNNDKTAQCTVTVVEAEPVDPVDPEPKDEGTNPWILIGTVGGSVLGILVISIAAYYVIKKRK